MSHSITVVSGDNRSFLVLDGFVLCQADDGMLWIAWDSFYGYECF